MLFPEELTRNEHNREFLETRNLVNFLILTLFENMISCNLYRSSRKKLGPLEKHKDYVVRAKAFHKKEETIRVSFVCPS